MLTSTRSDGTSKMAPWLSAVMLMRWARSAVSSGTPCCLRVANTKPGRMMGALAVNSRLVKPSWAVSMDLGCSAQVVCQEAGLEIFVGVPVGADT